MPTNQYRQAEKPDIPGMARIRASKLGTEPYWTERIAKYLNCEHHPQYALMPRVCFVALESDSVVGFIAGHLTRRYVCDGELQWIDVIPERRGTGISSELLRLLAKWFVEQRALKVCVNVDPANTPARRFYTRHGAESLNEHWLVWNDISGVLIQSGDANTSILQFESAADAVVNGDVEALRCLLHETPELIRARSTRKRRATLLHYVSANGVEEYRQKTPKNAVQVTETLLEAGAEVDATANIYGGDATTLGLVATSIHPERAHVQIALLEALLASGAKIRHSGQSDETLSAVQSCLANGRVQAAEFLASRGVPMNLEEAAGVGRLDLVKTFFNEEGRLQPYATREQMLQGFLWACGYGRNAVVEFFIDKGLDLGSQDRNGQTGLHWAAIFGQLETIRLLLDRKASLETRNVYGGTVLGQALWSAIHSEHGPACVPALEMLIAAGAKIEPGMLAWLEQQNASPSTKERVFAVLRLHRQNDLV